MCSTFRVQSDPHSPFSLSRAPLPHSQSWRPCFLVTKKVQADTITSTNFTNRVSHQSTPVPRYPAYIEALRQLRFTKRQRFLSGRQSLTGNSQKSLWDLSILLCVVSCPFLDSSKPQAKWEIVAYPLEEASPQSSVGRVCLQCRRPGFDSWVGKIPWEGIWYPLHYSWASVVAQMVRSLPAVWEIWVDAWAGKIPWRRKWQPTPVVSPGKSCGQRNLADYSPWGHKGQTRLSD